MFLLCACLSMVGCFDGPALVEARREVANLARLEEIDLGRFRTTLPRSARYSEKVEVDLHAFGHVLNRDLEVVRKSLEENGPLLRHRLLMTTRQMDRKDLTDPMLVSLRAQIADAVNETVPGEPLKSVGFYRFDYSDF